MRRGFLSSDRSEPTELVSILHGHHLGGHIAEVIKRREDDGKVVLRLLADDSRRAVLATWCNPLTGLLVPGARVLTSQVLISERTLTRLVASWSPATDAAGEAVTLAGELIQHIVSFLLVPRVAMSDVRAVGASSVAPDPERCCIANALDPASDNWWISDTGSMPCGVGEEWIAFRLGEEAAEGRPQPSFAVERVELKIPPMPSGPLSVRTFRLETAPSPNGPWTRASPDFVTLDASAAQPFHLARVEAAYLRIVCTRNAARAAADDARAAMARRGLVDPQESDEDRERALSRLSSSVGFFSIAFA